LYDIHFVNTLSLNMRQFNYTANRLYTFITLLSIVSAATLTGRIISTDGTTPKQTVIMALDILTTQSYTTLSTGNTYTLNLPDNIMVQVTATPTNNIDVNGWTVPGYFPASVGTFQMDTGNTKADVTVDPSYTIILVSYDSQGHLLGSKDFTVFNWAVDHLSKAAIRGTKITVPSINNVDTLGISVPLNSLVSIMTESSISDSEKVITPSDNNGNGITSSVAGGQILMLNLDIARTAVSRVQSKNTDSSYAPLATSTISAMSDSLNSNMPNTSEVARITGTVTNNAIYTETALDITKAQRSQYRMSNVNIKVVDESGKAVDGIRMTMDNKAQDFRFGVKGGLYNINTTSAWKLLRDAGVNSATVDFWWSATEPTSGHLENSDVITSRIEELLSLGFKLRATGLFKPSTSVLPAYATGLSFEKFGQALKDHVTGVVGTYCKQFELIEVSTDLNILGQSLGFDDSQILSLQQVSLRAINSAAPGVRTSITASSSFIPQSQSWLVSQSSMMYTEQWIDAGLPVDDIGHSIYNGVDAEPQYTIGCLSSLLDTDINMGRNVRVSEFTVPSSVPAEKRNTYMQQFYTVAYSKKNIREITWASLLAATPQAIGLFDQNMKPTSLFNNMKDIINTLTSMGPIALNSNGYATISPTGGHYTVNVYKDGLQVGSQQVHLTEGSNNRMSVMYNSLDNTASVYLNPTSGVMPGVLPTPSPQPNPQLGATSSVNKGSLPPWAIFLIAFGTVIVVASVVGLLVMVVLKRNAETAEESTIDIETSVPVGNVLPASLEGVQLDDSSSQKSISPDTWTAGPLATMTLGEEEKVEESDDSGGNESTDSDSDDMQDVQLDEEDVKTSDSSDSEEEHL